MRRLWERQTTRLGLLALAAASPLLAVLIYFNVDERRQELGEVVKDQVQVSRLAAARASGVLRNAARLLETLQQVPELAAADRASCQRILRGAIQADPSYVNLVVVDRDGSLFCAARAIDSTSFRESPKPWLPIAFASNRPVISEPFTTVTNGRLAIAVSAPTLSESGAAGKGRIIAAAIELGLFADILGAGMIPDSGTLSLIDRSHRVIAAFPADSTSLGALIPLRAEHEAVSDQPHIVDHPGGPLLVSAVSGIDSAPSGYHIVLGVSERAAFAAANARWSKFLLLLSLALLAAVALGAIVASKLIMRPTRELARVAQLLAQGDFGARAELAVGLSRLSALGSAINNLGMALERRESEVELALDKLRGSEDQYRLLFEKNPNPMWVFDAGTLRFLMVNDAAVRHYGYSTEEFLAMSIMDIRPAEDVARLVDVASNGKLQSEGQRWRHLTRDGRCLEVDVSANPLTVGTRPAILVCALDVTARVQAERAVVEAEERFRFALQAARLGVWDVNLRTGKAHWSDIAESMHGLAPGSFGRSEDAFMAAVYPDDRAATRAAIADAIARGVDADVEYRVLARPERRIRSIGQFMYDGDHRPLRGIGISIDVTERRQMEDHLRHAQKLEAVGQLAGGVAHDFNNLLTVISGNAELALITEANADVRDSLDEIIKAASRAAQLTRQLLAFSRKQVLSMSSVDVDQMIRELMPMLGRLIEEDIQLEYDGCPDMPTAVVDRAELEQAIINLVVNARDALVDGGAIRIECALIPDSPEGTVRIAVIDQGSGMSREALARAFEPFFTTKPPGKGTGLGLASVYGSVKQAGGEVVIESEVGRGTTVTMLLPATARSAATVKPDEAPLARGHGTILLVEDQDGVRSFAARILRDAGFEVLEAVSAIDAVRIAADHPSDIDLIFSDVVMPGPSIVDAIGRIRADRPDVAVILTSGYPDAEVRRRLGAMQAEIFPKPFSIRGLLDRVSAALAHRGHPIRFVA
jgi:two-component system, cell cycle sensor histidine kinase and response regulator CckA